MSWDAVQAIMTAACAMAALVSGYASLAIRAAMDKLRADLAEARSRDRDELREWINGSFMRAAVAESRIKSIEFRMEHVEDELKRARQ